MNLEIQHANTPTDRRPSKSSRNCLFSRSLVWCICTFPVINEHAAVNIVAFGSTPLRTCVCDTRVRYGTAEADILKQQPTCEFYQSQECEVWTNRPYINPTRSAFHCYKEQRRGYVSLRVCFQLSSAQLGRTACSNGQHTVRLSRLSCWKNLPKQRQFLWDT